jgi:histidinol-phosphate aminotransferase
VRGYKYQAWAKLYQYRYNFDMGNEPEEINLKLTTIKEPLPDFIYESLKDYAKNANAYRPQPKVLIEKIAAKYHLSEEMIFLTAGIDEAIQMFAKAYGKNAYIFTPTYFVYTDVEVFGGKLNQIYSMTPSGYEVPIKDYPGATLIFLANPNNPSGFTIKEKVAELVRKNPGAIVVIDEAYGEFAEDLSLIGKVQDFPNLAVLRSFSKAYGMAGNRIGYIVTNLGIISVVKNMTQWANVSYLSVGAAVCAMEHEDYFKKSRNDLIVRRDSFFGFLQEQGFTLLPSRFNCVLIKFGKFSTAEDFVSYLNSKGVSVNYGNGISTVGLDKSFVRMAIGNTDQMEKVKIIIQNYHNEKK